MGRLLSRAVLPATVGEWVQGWIGGRESLVSLVTDWTGSVEICAPDVGETLPPAPCKAQRAFREARRRFGEGLGGDAQNVRLVVNNPHPPAKGLATSTMDIAGAFSACAACAGAELSDETLLSLCAQIEPSDGIMFGGLALVDHIRGELLDRLDAPPGVELAVLLPEGSLDTEDYRADASRLACVKSLAAEHERAYGILREGLRAGDAEAVAEAASLSAALQQRVMPRDEWPLIERARRASGALGVAVAHSGTASALLFAPGDVERARYAAAWLEAACAASLPGAVIGQTRAAAGGIVSQQF